MDQIESLHQSVVNGFKEMTVGPNDVLIVRIRTTDIPPARVERFLRKVKVDLQPVWDRAGIAKRVLYEAGDESGFAVIHTHNTLADQKKQRTIPVIG